jgi:hypothetical protein
MAEQFIGGKAILDAYDITPYLRDLKVTHTADVKDATTLNDTQKRYDITLRDSSVELSGFYYGAPNEIDDIYETVQDGSVLTIFKNNSSFAPASAFSIVKRSKTIETPADDFAAIKFEFQSDVGFQALIFAPYATRKAAGVSETYDLGSALTATFYVFINVTDLVGSVTVNFQDSPDGTTFTTRLSQVFSAVGSAVLSGTRTWQRYTRVEWTFSGTSPSATFVVSAQKI